MARASFPSVSQFRRWRRPALVLCLAWPLFVLGCAQIAPIQTLPAVRGVAQAPTDNSAPQTLGPPVQLEFHPAEARKLPINLDTVLRLAQDQNGQVAIAREKLNEAFAQQDIAALAWLPDLWVGASYYRHEGGIQNEDGSLTHSSFGSLFGGAEIHGRFNLQDAVFQKVDAERKVWQQKGELSKLTSENLLEAATTYVDLLAARAGEAILLRQQSLLEDLLKQATSLADVDPGVKVEVSRIRSELEGQQQLMSKLRSGARNAVAKLLYLLGLDPSAELVVMDRQLLAFTLVDTTGPVERLVEQALTSGPGVREMEGLLNLIHGANAKAQGLGMLMPTIDLRLAEGIFGTGPGASSTWDNRFDVILQARWNLTPFATARDRRRVMQSKMEQMHLTYKDLRGKLTMGVQEAYETVNSGHEQMGYGERQIKEATDAYDLSKIRLKNYRLKGATPSEVLAAIRTLGGAQLTYLQAVRELNKAQLRLVVLLGVGSEACHR